MKKDEIAIEKLIESGMTCHAAIVVREMKKDGNVLFATERLIENGVPKIICPYCGYITRGWVSYENEKSYSLF